MQRALFSIANATNETRNLDELYKSIHTTLSALMPADNILSPCMMKRRKSSPIHITGISTTCLLNLPKGNTA